MSGKPFIPQLMLAALAVAGPLATAEAQALPPPPAGRYLCGVASAPSPGGTTSRTDYGSSRARLTLDGSTYLYEAGPEPRRGSYRYDGAGKVLFVTGELAGSTADWGPSPYRNQPGRFWLKGNFCDLSTN
jgi:hypothetical protein